MISTISTHESAPCFSQVSPALKTACTAFVIASIVSANIPLAEIPKSSISVETPAVFSIPSAIASVYNGNSILNWEDISIMTSKKAESLQRIDQIEALEKNWNGNGAAAFSKEILEKARELVALLSEQPIILPTGRDSIQLEYENQNGDYLEFELFEGGRLKMFSYTHDGVAETKDIAFESANEAVCAFYGL